MLNDKPSFSIHAIGEQDGDCTWLNSLPADQRDLITENQHDDSEMSRYLELFAAADTDGDRLLDHGECKQFFILNHDVNVEKGLPSFDPRSASNEQWESLFEKLEQRNPW